MSSAMATIWIGTRALAPLVLFLSLLASPAAGGSLRGGRGASPPSSSRSSSDSLASGRRLARGPESCDLRHQCYVPVYRDCFHKTSFECKALQGFEEPPSLHPTQRPTQRPTPTTAPVPTLKTVVQLPIQIVADNFLRELTAADRSLIIKYISDTLRDGLDEGVELIAVEFAGVLAGSSHMESARFPLRIALQIEGDMADFDMSHILELLRDRALSNLEVYLRNRPGDNEGASDLSLDFELYSFDDLVDVATTDAPSPGPSEIGLLFKDEGNASYLETVAESISHNETAAENVQTSDEDKAVVLGDEKRGLVWWAWGFIAVTALAVVLSCAKAAWCCFRPSRKRGGMSKGERHADISHFVRNGAMVAPVAFDWSEQQLQGREKRKAREVNGRRARGLPPPGFSSVDVSRRSNLDSSHRSDRNFKADVRRQSRHRVRNQTRGPPTHGRRRPKETNRVDVLDEVHEQRPRKIRRAISQTEIEERWREARQNDEESLCTAIVPYVESKTRHGNMEPPGKDRTTARNSRSSRVDLDQSARSAGKTRKRHKQQGPRRKGPGRIPKGTRVRKDEMFICPITKLPRVSSPQFEPTFGQEDEDSQPQGETVCSKPSHIVCDAGTTCNSLISMGGADATPTAAGQDGGIRLGTGTPLPPHMGEPPPRRRAGRFAEMAARLSVKDDDTLESALESIDPFQ